MSSTDHAKKVVRFQDLSLIQEQEEDGKEEITIPVPQALDTDQPADQAVAEDGIVRPAACPFGDRIARERAEREKQKSTNEEGEDCKPKEPEVLKFPQNIIQLQCEEKVRALKERPTAGVNPNAGKDRGRSFVISRNYFGSVPNTSVILHPDSHCKKSLAWRSRSCSPPTPRGNAACVVPKPATLPDHLIPSLIGDGNLYRPEKLLTQTVNPYLAPSLQRHGSAAYELKTTPQELLTAPNTVAASNTNCYLHQQSAGGHYTASINRPLVSHCIQSRVSNPEQIQQQSQYLGTTQTSSMNFLRDNFPSPVPISKETLFHIEQPSTITRDSVLTRPSVQAPTSNNRVIFCPEPPSYPPPQPSPQNMPVYAASVTGPAPNQSQNQMCCVTGPSEIYTQVSTLSRVQEKEELQKLNDRFSAYVNRVRQLSQQANNVDTSAFLRSTKILEDEIVNLKAIYEAELERLRKELDTRSHENHSLATQNNKHTVVVGELQDRLNIETDKTAKLLEEINIHQRRIAGLESQVQDAQIAVQKPMADGDQLRRTIENLTREAEQWKHRYEHEQVARQEAEGKIQQMMQKIDLADQVHNQQIIDYQSRLDMASASILSLESKVRDLSTADVSVGEMLKQVRESAEAELKKFQVESEEQYSRNLTALKAQIDNDADALQRHQTEKSELRGSIGELHAKIRNLEGQIINLQHQKQTLEDSVQVERNRSADNIQQLERKLREVQDLLVIKMKEVCHAREANIPLKAEIEALKILMEEEERRLRVPLGLVQSAIVQSTVPATLTTSQIVNSSQPHSQILTTGCTSNQVLMNASKQAQIRSEVQQQLGDGSSSPVQARPSSAGVVRINSPLATTQQEAVTETSIAAPVSTAAVTTAPLTTTHLEASYDYSSNMNRDSGLTNPLYPYIPSPPLDVNYVPDALQSTEEIADTLAYDADYGAGLSGYDLYMQGFSLPMTGPRYHYETTPSLNRLQTDPSPRAVGPIQTRAKSAPAHDQRTAAEVTVVEQQDPKEKNVPLIPANLGSGCDYFDNMFHDLQRNTLYSKPRPKSSPIENRLPSSFHDYTVSTSSAIGDLKILEVNQDGKFVRLVNDGPTEFEFGGYMVQQNVGGHPVAVFRFPPRTKFAPDSTITVWSAMNDPMLHNPPTDYFWKEQQKWGTGPECTTILCRANGQAVAWTTAAHRFTKDAFMEITKTNQEKDEIVDDESLTELNLDANGPKPGNVYLRREKQQPRSLVASKHPHGNSPSTPVHSQVGLARPLRSGNDNSSYNRQSRTQTTRPDPIPGQPYAGAPAQRMGSAPLKKLGCCTQVPQPPTIRGNGSFSNKPVIPGETCEGPNPFMKPHSRFGSGLEQLSSQHHPDFLPPMPQPTQVSW